MAFHLIIIQQSWSVLEVCLPYSAGPSLLVSSFDFGDGNTAWVIDLVGRVWFTTSVSMEKPEGSGQWWQVRTAELNEAVSRYLSRSDHV